VFPQISATLSPYILWILGSLAVIVSLRRLAGLEFTIAVFIGLIVLFLFGVGFLRGGDVAVPIFDASAIFLPFGIVLFSLSGRAGISAITDYYERNKLSKEKLHHAIIIGTITPAVIYILFAFSIYWLSGGNVSEDALTGILGLPYVLLALIGSLGVFALLTSYFFLGIEVRDIFRYDLKFPSSVAILMVTVLPMAIFLFGISNFIKLVGITGGIFLAVESIMVIFIYSKVKSWSILSGILVGLFAVGALHTMLQVFS